MAMIVVVLDSNDEQYIIISNATEHIGSAYTSNIQGSIGR